MTTQQRNPEMVNLLLADLQGRYEPQFALANTMALMKALPGLRGFWPMSAIDSSGGAFDQSGNARTLTYNGNPTYNYAGLAPYIDLDGTGDYLSRADEAGLDILGTESYVASAVRGLTVGGWFWSDVTPAGGADDCIGKFGAAANRSYVLGFADSGGYFGIVSVDGSTLTTVTATSPAFTATAWHFMALRFDPSTELAIFVDGEWTLNTTSIPASIFNSTAGFAIGTGNNFTANMDGRASLCFLSAAYLSDTIINNLYHQSRALFGV